MVGPKGHFCDLENAEVTNGVEHDDWTVKGEWRAVLLALRPRCVTGRGRWGVAAGAGPLGRGHHRITGWWAQGAWGVRPPTRRKPGGEARFELSFQALPRSSPLLSRRT